MSRYILILTNKYPPYGVKPQTVRSPYDLACPACGVGVGRNCSNGGRGMRFCPARAVNDAVYYTAGKGDSLIVLDVQATDDHAARAWYHRWCKHNGDSRDTLPTVIAVFRAEPVDVDGDALREALYEGLSAEIIAAVEQREREQLARLKAKYEGGGS
jgi:hypothetical protein